MATKQIGNLTIGYADPVSNANYQTGATKSRSQIAKDNFNTLSNSNEEFFAGYNNASKKANDNGGYKNIFDQSAFNTANNSLVKALEKVGYENASTADGWLARYNNLSSDDKWDVYQNLQDAKNKFIQAYTKADNENNQALKEAYGDGLKYVSMFDDMISDIDKGDKSFGKSFGDWITSGGIAGDMAKPMVNALGDITGSAETSKFVNAQYDTKNEGNNGVVGAINTAGTAVGNIGANVVTGGAYGLGTSAAGLAHEGISALNDADRTYYVDQNGNVVRQNQTDAQKAADIGGAAFNLGLNVLGKAGVGPTLKFGNNASLQELAKSGNVRELAKGVGKYAAKELPWAMATSAADTAIQASGYGQDAWNKYGENLGKNIMGDVAMDVTGAVRQGVRGNTVDNSASRVPEAQETELYRAIVGETNQPKTASSQWDSLAQEGGYKDYNNLVDRYKQANPNKPVDANSVLDWMDKASISTNIETPDTTSSKTSKESKLRYAQGQELLKQYGTVDQPMARATKATETFQEIADMGFTKPGDVERVSNAVTGSNGAVSKLNNNIISSAKPVSTFEGKTSGQTMDEFINSSIEHNMLSGTPQGKAVERAISAYLNSLPSRADGSVSFEDNASDVFKVVQNLEARAAELEGRGGSTYHRATTEDVHQAAVLKDVANLLKDRIYEGADVKAALTPEVSNSLKAIDPNNKSWAKTVDDFVNNAESPKDLRAFQRPFVRANRYIDNQYVQAATIGGRMVGGANSLTAALPTTKAGLVKQAVNTIWNSNPAHRAKASIYGKLADKQASATTASAQTTNIPNKMSDNSADTAKKSFAERFKAGDNPQMFMYSAVNNGVQDDVNKRQREYITEAANEAKASDTLPSSQVANSNASTAVYNAIAGGTGTTNPEWFDDTVYFFRPTGDEWSDMLSRAMKKAREAEDYDAFGQLFEMYKEARSDAQKSATSDVTNLSATQQAQLAKLNSAEAAIDELEGLFEKAGGGKGPIAGNLQSIAGSWGWDSNANTYNQLAEGLVNQIAQAVGKTDSLNTEGEVKRALRLIPQLTDDATTAKNKLEELRRMLANTKASYNTAYGLTG